MSESEELINNLNESIQQKTNEIEGFIDELRRLPNTKQNSKKRLQLATRIKLREEQIKKNRQQLNTLQQLQRDIEKAKRITNRVNNMKRNQDTPTPTPPLENSDEDDELLQELNDLNQEQPKTPTPTPVEEEKGDDDTTPNITTPITTPNITTRITTPNITIPNPTKITGFTETIVKNNKNNQQGPQKINMELCPQISDIGEIINNKYFFPSQFPNLTKIKPVINIVKGGKKSRKHITSKNISKKRRKSRKYY
jgi:hypothetical protein